MLERHGSSGRKKAKQIDSIYQKDAGDSEDGGYAGGNWIDTDAGYDISGGTEHIKKVKKRKTGNTAPEKGQQYSWSFFDAEKKTGEQGDSRKEKKNLILCHGGSLISFYKRICGCP